MRSTRWAWEVPFLALNLALFDLQPGEFEVFHREWKSGEGRAQISGEKKIGNCYLSWGVVTTYPRVETTFSLARVLRPFPPYRVSFMWTWEPNSNRRSTLPPKQSGKVTFWSWNKSPRVWFCSFRFLARPCFDRRRQLILGLLCDFSVPWLLLRIVLYVF